MTQSILTSVKKVLGIDEAYTVFDVDVIMHINSAFGTLNQLGIGPEAGFEIVDKTTTWDAVIGTNSKYNGVKTYIFLKTRIIFDPPGTSYLIDSLNHQIKELEWRLNAVREETEWVDPDPGPPPNDTIIDGGSP